MISTNFMKRQLYLSILFSLLGLSVYAQRTEELFDASWKFSKADVTGGETVNLNDADWRTVELPHDWSVEDLPDQSDSVIGPFSKQNSGRTATGYTVGGIGWYRKHFKLGRDPELYSYRLALPIAWRNGVVRPRETKNFLDFMDFFLIA